MTYYASPTLVKPDTHTKHRGGTRPAKHVLRVERRAHQTVAR
jgi:hypothetical protein